MDSSPKLHDNISRPKKWRRQSWRRASTFDDTVRPGGIKKKTGTNINNWSAAWAGGAMDCTAMGGVGGAGLW
jgi:hypothetical protein